MPKASKSSSVPTKDHRSVPYPSITTTTTTPAMQAPPGPLPTSRGRHTSSPWSSQDDTTLLQARHQGQNWAPIATTHFPSKTANACRKRHERLIEKSKSADSWDSNKVEKLAGAYMELREQMWKILAQRTDEKWQEVEKKCMEKGLIALKSVSQGASRRSSANQDNPVDPDDSGLGPDQSSLGPDNIDTGTDEHQQQVPYSPNVGVYSRGAPHSAGGTSYSSSDFSLPTIASILQSPSDMPKGFYASGV